MNGGAGQCAGLCDPARPGSCAGGYSCVALGVALVATAPVIHVCQVTGSDAGLPTVGLDGGGFTGDAAWASDAPISDVRVHVDGITSVPINPIGSGR